MYGLCPACNGSGESHELSRQSQLVQTLRSRFFPTSEFEQQVEELGLRPGEYEASPQLQRWCSRNADLHYVPEYLLKLWEIKVNDNWGIFS